MTNKCSLCSVQQIAAVDPIRVEVYDCNSSCWRKVYDDIHWILVICSIRTKQLDVRHD